MNGFFDAARDKTDNALVPGRIKQDDAGFLFNVHVLNQRKSLVLHAFFQGAPFRVQAVKFSGIFLSTHRIIG